jgi:hypothetical protein
VKCIYWEENPMIKKSIYSILVILLFIYTCGCSTTKYYGRYQTEKVTVGDKIIVTMKNEEVYTLTLSEIVNDKISGKTGIGQSGSESTIVIPVDSIQTIQVKKPGIAGSFVAATIISGILIYLSRSF